MAAAAVVPPLEDIYRQKRMYVFRLCRRMVHNDALAEDLTQETFVRITEGYASFRGVGLSSWLYLVTRNTVINHLRRPELETVSLDELANPDSDAAYTRGDTVAAPMDPVDLRILLGQIMQRLSPEWRAALEYKAQGHTFRDIARLMGGLTVACVQTHIFRARKRVRGQI